MKKTRVMSALVSLALFAVSVPCTPVSASENNRSSLAKQIAEGLPDEYLPYYPADPEDPSDEIPGFVVRYSYEGIAVTCKDIESLKANGVNGEAVVWSDGYWSSYWDLKQDNPDAFLVQPLDGLSSEFGDYTKYEGGILDGAEDCTFHVPQEYADSDEPIYVIYATARNHADRKATIDRLEAALAADENVTALGVLFCGAYDPVEYMPADILVVPERDGVLEPDTLLNQVDEAALMGKPWKTVVRDDGEIYVTLDCSGCKTQEEMEALAESVPLKDARKVSGQLEQIEGVKYAVIIGPCSESVENVQEANWKIEPIKRYSVSADSGSFTEQDLLRQIHELKQTDGIAPNYLDMEYTPIDPPEENCYVNYYDYDQYEGLLIYSSVTPEMLEDSSEAGVLAEALRNDDISMDTLEKYSDALQWRYPLAQKLVIPSDIEQMQTDQAALYVLSCEKSMGTVEKLIPVLMQDPRIKVAGVLSSHFHIKAMYDEMALELRVVLEDNCEIPAWIVEQYEVLETQRKGQECSLLIRQMPDLDEAVSMCRRIEAADEVKSAWMFGTFLCDDNASSVSAVSVLPLRHFATGDLNGDGETNIGDAVALARFNAEDSELDSAALNLDEADLNADGTVDSLDLAEMLERLADSGE